jgi:hypothetical protein
MNDDRVTKSSTNPVRLGQNLTIGGAASVSDSAASNVTHASVPIANGQVPQITLPTGVNLAASSGLIDQIRKNNNASTIADLSNATNPSALITPVAFPAEDNLPIVARLVASSNRSDTSSESSRAVPFGLSALSTSAGLDPSSEPSMISPATMAASRLGIAEVSGKTATVANSMAIIAGNAVGEDDHEPQMRGSKIERAAMSDAAIAAAIKLSATESNSALIGAVTQALKVNAEPSAGVSPVMTRSDSVMPFTTNVLERQELKTDLIKNDVDPANIEVRSNDKDQGVSSRVTAEVNFVLGSSPALGLAPSSVISTDRFGAMSAPSQATSSSAQAASPLMNSVSVEIKQLLTNGGGSVRIALTPPEQGMLQLDLVVSDSGLATLEVFGVTESIRERLESGSTTLQRQFEQMGLTLSLSLFDHGKGSESPAARDPQVLNDKSADLPPGHTPRSAKRADAAVGDDTGTMINFIA